jgi:selenocysteine-specific elongation factor
VKIKQVQREVVAAMVGTAGHVDHGKTTLVGMLTGCDTDRLSEEKARGLSINLGFAPCVLPGRRMIGIVDVPGHKDFIRNMVAGAASIDVLMLVTAADDGVMPQTAEHMQIIRLLRRPRVMVVLTKIDLVDEETQELARDDVAEYMARIGYPDVPILPASNVTGDGLMAVREKLYELVDQVQDRTPDHRRFRMNVERSFSVEGYGTVATGIPISGQGKIGDKLELLPAGRPTSVRAVQVYKTDSDAAIAGACAAINLRDIGPDELERGMTLVAAGAYEAITAFTATIESVAQDRALKRRFAAKLHVGTSISDATVRLLDGDSLPPGGRGLVEIRLGAPVALAAGDRFVIRSLSPVTTVAGGSVLATATGRLKRSSPHLLPRLESARDAIERDDDLASELLAGPRVVLKQSELRGLSRLEPEAEEERIQALVDSGVLVILGGGGLLVAPRLAELADRLAGELRRYHESHPWTWGMTSTHACEILDLPPKSFKGIGRALREDGRIGIKHGHLALVDFEPALTAKQIQTKDAILARIEEEGARPPAIGDLTQKLKISAADMKLSVKMLTDEGRIRTVGTNLFSVGKYEVFRQNLLSLFEKQDEVGLAEFREISGLSRNLAWSVLEAFDGEGLTRKVGEVRVLVRAADAPRTGDEA